MNTQTRRADSRTKPGWPRALCFRALQVLTHLLLGPGAAEPSGDHWLSPHSTALPPALCRLTYHPSVKAAFFSSVSSASSFLPSLSTRTKS